jgi:hypothetical protein
MEPLDGTPDERLGWMLALCDFGIELQRQNIRREFPDADEEDVARRLRAWLRDRPGAEFGDGEGRPVTRGLVPA